LRIYVARAVSTRRALRWTHQPKRLRERASRRLVAKVHQRGGPNEVVSLVAMILPNLVAIRLSGAGSGSPLV
jgi:hypothetical protein